MKYGSQVGPTYAPKHPRIYHQKWITHGNPTHYDGAGKLLRELRERSRDEDLEKHQRLAIGELETSFQEEHGKKLTESLAVRYNMSDEIADLLSDLSPEGFVFVIRENLGNSNYCYVDAEKEVRERLETNYGDLALRALETSCVVKMDYQLGYEHVMSKIHPALEEEILADDRNDG